MTARPTASRRVRVYETLRTAHLERAHDLPPSSILYRRRRYDFDEALLPGLDLIEAGPVRTACVLALSDVRELEVNEPLMLSSLRRTALALVVARLRAALLRRPLTVATYAIANDDPFRPAVGPGLRRLRRRVDRWLLGFVARRIDRIAFGTSSARDLYASLVPGVSRAASTLIQALPARCGCLAVATVRDPDRVVFLGSFEERKGIRTLLAAWPRVVGRWPAATLAVVGKGELLAFVEDQAAARDDISLLVDPERAEIHRTLAGSALVVLLSQRTPRWREQVGLPLVEGLAHGCSVLGTTETGLADWLAAHGHGVVDAGAGPVEVAEAIVGLLRLGRSAASVLGDLPSEDGRLAADAWMFPLSANPAAVT